MGGGERTRSCGLLPPGTVRLWGLLRLVRSCGLLGLTPGAYPCASTRPPDMRTTADAAKSVGHIPFTVRLRSNAPRRAPRDACALVAQIGGRAGQYNLPTR